MFGASADCADGTVFHDTTLYYFKFCVTKYCSGYSNCSGHHRSSQKTSHTAGKVAKLL